MAEKLKKHLHDKSEMHLHLKLLQSQWDFDEELIPKALQNITAIFPQFSRHDSSHSTQILINIERLLGDTISSLTATDTWLLLEAAYWHDIGMIVTSNDIAADIQSIEFKQYVDGIASQNGHELQSFAKSFSSFAIQSCFSAAKTPHQAVELYRNLLAEWYRGRHSGRAVDIIDDPWQKAGISSPRNELVPKRLFRVLGQICQLHGSDFESILKTLPLREAGMATEDCHPRFVACLLRLGDLFDLDDNRFCPVMLRRAGDIQSSTQAHIDKHAAIRHFRLDPERVEIIAECDGYDSYEATDQWFTWIENEFRCQMTHWNDIVPNRLFGLLPTLGSLEVRLNSYEILDPGQRPHFDVDPQQVFELLQGAGLYRDRWQSIRELLQNAVDATLMRIWLTYAEEPRSTGTAIDWQNPLSQKVKDIFALYPVDVSLSRCKGTEPGRVQWQLEIRDRGVGISKNDLAFLRSVGASSKNTERKNLIANMPNWMRPSGAFGIGLQSSFMLSNEVVFESKSMLTGDTLKIEMKSPIGAQRGLIYIQRCKRSPGQDYGTILSIKIDSDAIPKSVSISHGAHNFTETVLAEFDPIQMSDVPYEAAKIVDEVIRFSTLSPLSILLTFDGQPLGVDDSVEGSDQRNNYFHPDTGVMLHSCHFGNWQYSASSVAFRGQNIEKFHSQIPFVKYQADILAELAPDTLTINRNDIKDTAREHINQILVESVIGYIVGIDCHELSDEEMAAVSAFLLICNRINVCPDLIGQWTNMVVSNLDCSIVELCSKDNFDIYVRASIRYSNKETEPDAPFIVDSYHSTVYQLLFKYWKEQNGYVQKDVVDNWSGIVLRFSKTRNTPLSEKYLIKVLTNNRSHYVGGRSSMPTWDKFDRLAAEVSNLSWCSSLSDCHPYQKHFVLPFFFSNKQNKITTDGLDELCAWTIKHTLYEGNITESEIKDLYMQFIEWVDNELMEGFDEWKTLRGQLEENRDTTPIH